MANTPLSGYEQQDKKNSKTFEWIVIVATTVVTAVCWLVAAKPFDIVHQYPIAWAIPVLYGACLIFCIVKVLKVSAVTEESKLPYILLILLFFFSMWAIFHVQTGLSLN